MAKTKEQKSGAVISIADRFQRMQGAVLADFTGVRIHALEGLRREARKNSCEYLVVKKTLYRRAAAAHNVPADGADTSSALSVLFGFADPVSPARIAKTFARTHETFRVVGGLLREDAAIRTLSRAECLQLGDLPSREELVAIAVGSIAAPLRGLVGALQGNLRNLVGVLGAIQKTK